MYLSIFYVTETRAKPVPAYDPAWHQRTVRTGKKLVMHKEIQPVGIMLIQAETRYVSETLIFPYSFVVADAVKDILAIITKLSKLLPQDADKKLEARNFVFSFIEDFQNALMLHEAITEGSGTQVTIKQQAETHADLWKVHHELHALLGFYSTQASRGCVKGDLIEETVDALTEEYN